MPLRIDSNIALFADDAYLYKVIENKNDSNKLQCDIDKLVQWENDWSKQFHPDKCFLLKITNKLKFIDSSYQIHGTQLKLVEKAKYLGVIISKNLSWKQHIFNISSKANSIRMFLQRNLVKSDRNTRLQCYKTYIRPIVEYACTIWNPVDNAELTSHLEKVQRKSLR